MAVACLAALAFPLAASGPPRLMWEVKLTDASGMRHDVQGLRFSWDGQWIAAVVAHLRTEETAPNDLILAPLDGDTARVRRLTIKEELLSTPQHPGIHWSPGGDYVALETKHFSTILIGVAVRSRCELPLTTVFGGFVGSDRIVSADWEAPKDPASIPVDFSTANFYGTDCRKIESTKWSGHVRQIEPYAPGGLLAISLAQSGVRVFSPRTGTDSGRLRESDGSIMRFGEKGSVVCKAEMPGGGSLACYQLATGDRIAHPDLSGGAPMDVSSESSLVLASNADAWYDMRASGSRFKFRHWIVWDYRTQKEVTRLPYSQPRRGYEASPGAMAPDGRHFAIGAGDRLRLYETPGL